MNKFKMPKKEIVEKKSWGKIKILFLIALIIWLGVGSLLIVKSIIGFVSEHEFRSPIIFQNPITKKVLQYDSIQKEASESAGIIEYTFAEEKPKEGTVLLTTDVIYEGFVSYYSHAGCLGCHPEQLMGNGQPFDEMAMTLAIPCEDIISKKYKYNTKVMVTNLDNGKSIEGLITDCGGFSKYNRVADLSKGMYEYLEAKTDKSIIKIELI